MKPKQSCMPRGKTNAGVSNLSVVIPRRVHRMVRLKFLSSGAVSFASYIAWWLAQAPETLTASQLVQVLEYETELKAFTNGKLIQ